MWVNLLTCFNASINLIDSTVVKMELLDVLSNSQKFDSFAFNVVEFEGPFDETC